MITVKSARVYLGEASAGLSDQTIEQLLTVYYRSARVACDSFIRSKRTEAAKDVQVN